MNFRRMLLENDEKYSTPLLVLCGQFWVHHVSTLAQGSVCGNIKHTAGKSAVNCVLAWVLCGAEWEGRGGGLYGKIYIFRRALNCKMHEILPAVFHVRKTSVPCSSGLWTQRDGWTCLEGFHGSIYVSCGSCVGFFYRQILSAALQIREGEGKG